MKKVLVQFDLKGMSVMQYDQIWKDLRASGHANPKGLLHHFGAPSTKGMMVSDVWESAERFKEFGKVLMPIFEKNKIPKSDPLILPLHNEYNAKLVAM